MFEALGRILSLDQVLSDPGSLRAYDCDAYTVDKAAPQAVVLPETTEEVAQVVRWCHASGTPFTARGAGTGLSGGALAATGGVIISTKRLNQILEIDLPNRRLRAQAGIANKRISDAVIAHGLHFAPDPSSQSVSTLGGNIAENSGGPHTLKYGVTVQHVQGVTLVHPTGQIMNFSRGPGLDWLGLIVGSEGTLGVVTEAWVTLTPIPKAIKTALISFAEVRQATESVAAVIEAGVVPAALEIMDRGILSALQMAFNLEFAEGSQALLLIECDGDDSELVERELAVATGIFRRNQALRIDVAQNEVERQKLWTARKKGIGAMGRLAPTIVTHDGVIPRSKLPEMLDYIETVAQENGLGVANLFHAGDGNLHPCFYFDDREEGIIDRVIHAGETIMRRCVELGGSISGEHGIGVEKQDLMPLMFTEIDLRVQAMAKAIFNETGLCNPCKVLPNQKGCVEHQKRWRGAAW